MSSLIDPEEARRLADDHNALVLKEIPRGNAEPHFRGRNMDRERAQSSGLAPRKSPNTTLPAADNPYRNHRAYSHYHRNLDRYRAGGVTTVSNRPHSQAVDAVEVPTPKTTDHGMVGAASPGTCAKRGQKEDIETTHEGLTPTADGIDGQSASVFPSPVETKSSEGTAWAFWVSLRLLHHAPYRCFGGTVGVAHLSRS